MRFPLTFMFRHQVEVTFFLFICHLKLTKFSPCITCVFNFVLHMKWRIYPSYKYTNHLLNSFPALWLLPRCLCIHFLQNRPLCALPQLRLGDPQQRLGPKTPNHCILHQHNWNGRCGTNLRGDSITSHIHLIGIIVATLNSARLRTNSTLRMTLLILTMLPLCRSITKKVEATSRSSLIDAWKDLQF